MLKILCKLVSKEQSNSMLKKVKSLMRNASSYPLSNLWFDVIYVIKMWAPKSPSWKKFLATGLVTSQSKYLEIK